LASIAAQACSLPDSQIIVIISENDLERQEALALVAQMTPTYRFAVHAYVSKARGISQARNTLLDHGFGTHNAMALAMVDDDQWIEPDWLENMYQTLLATDADAVGCRVVPDFMDVAPNWVQELRIFHRKPQPTGQVGQIISTCGVMLGPRILTIMPVPRFDTDYSFTGGGDTEFFLRLRAAGGRFGFCAEAVAHECYPAERQTLAWVRQRSERLAMTNMLIRMRQAKSRWFFQAQAVSLLLTSLRGGILLAVFFWHPIRRERALRVLLRVRGKLRALFGHAFEMYR
jgi:GT2 family glycosyltransferase